MKKLLLLLAVLMLASCSEDDTENLGSNLISIEVTDLQFNQATLEWTRPSLAEGTVLYEVVLDNQIIVSSITGTSFVIQNLSPETTYSGFVKALDETGQETFGEFSFTTRVIGGNTVHNGGYGLRYQFQVDNLAASNITIITGQLSINSGDITDLSPLTDLVSIGSLKVTNTSLANLDGLENVIISNEPKTLNIWGNDQLENLNAITVSNSEFDWVRLEDNLALQNISGIGIAENGVLRLIRNNSITSLSGLRTGSGISFLLLNRLPNLENISALQSLNRIDDFEIYDANSLSSLNGLQNLTSCSSVQLIEMESLTSLEGLNGITTLDKLYLSGMPGLNSLNGLNNLTEIGMEPGNYPGDDIFILNRLNITDLTGLTSLTLVRNIDISGCDALTSLEGTSLTDSWNIDSDKRLRILSNPVLTDFCGLTEFVQNANLNVWVINGNAYNPSIGQIMNPEECSQ